MHKSGIAYAAHMHKRILGYNLHSRWNINFYGVFNVLHKNIIYHYNFSDRRLIVTEILKNKQLVDVIDNVTTQHIFTHNDRLSIENLFTVDRDEIFEDGIESNFSKSLIYYIQKYGNEVIEILSGLMDHGMVNPEIASEAMRWLGHVEHPQTYDKRLWLLERSLKHVSARVRDGATLGLASLGDLDAIPYLREAIELEQCAELRKDMEQVLAELWRAY